jgi:ankyrin repeat protein
MKIVLQAIVATFIIATGPAGAQSLERLLEATERGDVKEVGSYLDRGLDANSTGPQGHTILMAASRLGHIEVVRLLLARKADPNRQAPSGDTAVMLASLGGQLEVVKLLATHGAGLKSSGWNALHYAAFGGSPEVVRYLLERGADKNALAPNWYTPLMLAARNGHVAAARALLQDSPDLNHRGLKGETALAIARTRGDAEMIELLKRAGAGE